MLFYTSLLLHYFYFRFRVKVDPIKMEKFDSGVQTKFMDYIDVPASSKKDFKLAFYAYKESFTAMKVCIHVPSLLCMAELSCFCV